uniref:Uncharacterized protein n=1 Tax=Romanomermis culicivorax TaxID=13658 RepID=A0A915KFH1_ROMCU
MLTDGPGHESVPTENNKLNNESTNSPTIINSNNNDGNSFNNRLNSQHWHSPAVSPQILRRTLYKLDKQQKEKNKKFLLLDEQKSSGSGDWISTGGSTSSSVESPLFGTRFAFMEGKISRFQLKRLKIKQQALLEHGVWKPASLLGVVMRCEKQMRDDEWCPKIVTRAQSLEHDNLEQKVDHLCFSDCTNMSMISGLV